MPSRQQRITTDRTKCVNCLTCVLRCSFHKKGVFNPAGAYIKIVPSVVEPPEISFTGECDSCGICVKFCPYGALNIVEVRRLST